MIKAGVIGHPISHSLSPKLHNYWLKKYSIDGEYKAYDVAPEALAEFIRTMPERGLAGCNVTIPHKEKVMDYLDEIEQPAQGIGAVNTIFVRNGKLIGDNTDAPGFLENILPHFKKNKETKKRAVVLGAGGAARAVVFALQMYGVEEIIITNRTRERAEELTTHLFAYGSLLKVVHWNERNVILDNTDLLVNTTSLGMAGKEPLNISLDALPKAALVTDIVYKPLITPLLAAAQARGNPIVDGLGMLLHQAAPGFKEWFGLENLPKVDDSLRRHILAP